MSFAKAWMACLVVTGCAPAAHEARTFPPAARHEAAARSEATAPLVDVRLVERCRTIRAPTAARPHVVWRADPFASVFWAVDQWSRWDEQRIDDTYEAFFQQKFGADARDQEMLGRYRRLRLAYSRNAAEESADPAHPVNLLVPETTPDEAFARAFLCTGDARSAATILGMKSDEVAEVGHTFDYFSRRLMPIVTDAYVDRARAQIEVMAERATMTDYLDRMVDFYGVRGRVPGELTVEVLWGPPGVHRSTTLSDRMIVPLAERTALKPRDLASWVGVAVHEFGHHLLGYLPNQERNRLTTRILARTGIVRQRHPNLVDEATQAALGNLHFLRKYLPEGLDEESVYSFEPRLDHPDAIDSLARRAEPLVARALDKRESFGGSYLDAFLDEQTRLMPPLLRDHARVGFLLVGAKAARRQFDGLFWSISRFAYDRESGESFALDSDKNHGASRWIVLSVDDTSAMVPIAERAGAHGLDALSREVLRRSVKGCVRATRRPAANGAPGGFDIIVVGRDSGGLRETLIAIQRGISPEAAVPYCVR